MISWYLVLLYRFNHTGNRVKGRGYYSPVRKTAHFQKAPHSTRKGILAHFYFPASGQAVVTGVVPSPPRFLPSIFIAHRVQQSHCSSIVHRVLLTHALALSASQIVRKKKSQRIYTSTHSAGLELTKLTYTRLEDNLIRHRGDRRNTPPGRQAQYATGATGYDVPGPYWCIRLTTRAWTNRLYRLPPKKAYHVYIARSTYHYAYARQTKVNWKKETKKKKKIKERNEKTRKRKNKKGTERKEKTRKARKDRTRGSKERKENKKCHTSRP